MFDERLGERLGRRFCGGDNGVLATGLVLEVHFNGNLP